MRLTDASSRIENLFICCHHLLQQQGLYFFTKDHEKLTVYHMLSVIRPESQRLRLESDLNLSHHHLRKDFKVFMLHTNKLSEAFKLVADGAHTTRRRITPAPFVVAIRKDPLPTKTNTQKNPRRCR